MTVTSPNYRWYIVGLTLVNQALTLGVMIYSFALFVVPWLDAFGGSRSEIMMAIFLFQVIMGLLSPVFGRLMDQWPMRWLSLFGTVSFASGLWLLSQATAFWQIVVIHMTFLPVAMILCGTLASQTLVGKWFQTQRGIAIGISSTGTSMGGFLIPLLTSWLITELAWQGAVVSLAGLVLMLMLPLNYFLLRVAPPVIDAGAGQGEAMDARVWTTRDVLATRQFWIPVIGLIPVNAAFGGVQFNLGAYVSDLGMTQEFAAQLIAITSLAMIMGKFMFGVLAERVDHRYLYWFMACLLMLALLFFEGNPGRSELILAATCQGFATGGVLPVMGMMYSTRFGTLSFGRVLGLVNMFLMIGSFGSIFSGWMFDLTETYDYAFWTFGIMLVPCIVAMYFLPGPPTPDEPRRS